MAGPGPVYVIGPSSVGKSHLCRQVAREHGIEVRDLDAELGVPDLRDWSKVGPWLESVSGSSVLVDIGAGTQDACGDELARYLAPRRDQVILVTDDPEEAFRRNVAAGHREPSAWQDYVEVEFRRRAALYGVARHLIDLRQVEIDEATGWLLQLVSTWLGS